MIVRHHRLLSVLHFLSRRLKNGYPLIEKPKKCARAISGTFFYF
jgi:hypothetical protein